jgi:hypothetical protein
MGAAVRLQSRLDRVERILAPLAHPLKPPDSVTYRDKRREEAAGARGDLCPVSLGPLLGLLAAQDGARHVRQVLGPVRNLLDVRPLLVMLRHTGFR